jgi:hypothetical protein
MGDSDLEQRLRERGIDFGELHVEYSAEFGWRAAFKSSGLARYGTVVVCRGC